jgi:hypothetical protein
MTGSIEGGPVGQKIYARVVGWRDTARRVRGNLGWLRARLTAPTPSGVAEAPGPASAQQLADVGAETARLRTEVDALTDHVRMLTSDVAHSRWAELTARAEQPASGELPPFAAYSTPVASDFSHPRFYELCALLGHPPIYHRKLWEWAFILHKLIEAGVITEGSRGLGFGVGTEALPAVFAATGVKVVATDAPDTDAWAEGNQHSGSVEQLLHPECAPDAVVRRQVTHQGCDMNDIDPTLTGFDFNWSACAFEHLGTIEHGLDFVANAIEKTLKPGGIGVHTTELNVQSATDTITEGGTVLYRLSDLQRLSDKLTARGHHVEPIIVGPPSNAIDLHVDTAPYTPIHLRLKVAGFTTTSVGLVVRRGE